MLKIESTKLFGYFSIEVLGKDLLVFLNRNFIIIKAKIKHANPIISWIQLGKSILNLWKYNPKIGFPNAAQEGRGKSILIFPKSRTTKHVVVKKIKPPMYFFNLSLDK
jgi:hypothetical protein